MNRSSTILPDNDHHIQHAKQDNHIPTKNIPKVPPPQQQPPPPAAKKRVSFDERLNQSFSYPSACAELQSRCLPQQQSEANLMTMDSRLLVCRYLWYNQEDCQRMKLKSYEMAYQFVQTYYNHNHKNANNRKKIKKNPRRPNNNNNNNNNKRNQNQESNPGAAASDEEHGHAKKTMAQQQEEEEDDSTKNSTPTNYRTTTTSTNDPMVAKEEEEEEHRKLLEVLLNVHASCRRKRVPSNTLLAELIQTLEQQDDQEEEQHPTVASRCFENASSTPTTTKTGTATTTTTTKTTTKTKCKAATLHGLETIMVRMALEERRQRQRGCQRIRRFLSFRTNRTNRQRQQHREGDDDEQGQDPSTRQRPPELSLGSRNNSSNNSSSNNNSNNNISLHRMFRVERRRQQRFVEQVHSMAFYYPTLSPQALAQVVRGECEKWTLPDRLMAQALAQAAAAVTARHEVSS
ncbi:hypothetical protein ACA910_008457 [Epithemia clementina (nom. ined.)]